MPECHFNSLFPAAVLLKHLFSQEWSNFSPLSDQCNCADTTKTNHLSGNSSVSEILKDRVQGHSNNSHVSAAHLSLLQRR